jgi:hypothetical protein
MAAPSGCALSGARKRLRSTLRLLAAGGWNLAARAELRWKVHPRRGIPAAGRPGRTPPHPSMPRPADRGSQFDRNSLPSRFWLLPRDAADRRVQDRRRVVSDRVPSGQIRRTRHLLSTEAESDPGWSLASWRGRGLQRASHQHPLPAQESCADRLAVRLSVVFIGARIGRRSVQCVLPTPMD